MTVFKVHEGTGRFKQPVIEDLSHDYTLAYGTDILQRHQTLNQRAQVLGLSGSESPDEINANARLFERVESIRREASQRMGFCDVSDVVIPKVGLLAEPGGVGDIRSWYLTPHKLHTSHAVTGAVCVAAAAVINGTIAHRLARSDHANPRNFVIEHPAGEILIRLETKTTGPSIDIVAGTIRTVRLIMRGEVMVPN